MTGITYTLEAIAHQAPSLEEVRKRDLPCGDRVLVTTRNSLYLKPKPEELAQRPYDLTGPRRKKFLELLGKAQSEPRDTIRIGCISWSDAACVAAGKFLILFSEAGWTIDSNRVFRMEPTIPIDGMAMVSRIDNVDGVPKLPPHLGTWQKMDASLIGRPQPVRSRNFYEVHFSKETHMASKAKTIGSTDPHATRYGS